MADSQKAATPVKSKEKNSLLDMDIDKDFLGSWKPMSMTDDGMDFDFGPTTKGNKKAFKFDNMDMDFSLDADFDKLPSFKTNMPALDVSSPTKKSGKSKESSKEVSSDGEPRAKRDTFAFSFDFDEFADLDFALKQTKIDENSNKSKQKEGSSNTSDSGVSGDFLPRDVDAPKNDNISFKHPATWGVTISKVDTQLDSIKHPDPRNEDDHMRCVTDERCVQKPANAEVLEIPGTILPENIIPCDLQEPMQSPHHPSKKRSSPEPLSQEDLQESYGQSLADNASTENTFSDVQPEEPRNTVIVVSPSTGDDQNGNASHVAEAVPTRGLSLEKLSTNTNSQHQVGEMAETRDANYSVLDDTSKIDSHIESSMTHGEMVDKRNADSFSTLQEDSLDSGTVIGALVSEKERGSIPIRSKYFKKQNGSESELQQASVSSTKLIPIGNKTMNPLPNNPQQASVSFTKLIPIGNKTMNPLPNNPALEKREYGSINVESGSKYTGISRSLPKVLDNTRAYLNADNIKPSNEPMSTKVAHDIGPTKEETASRGSDQNPEHINTLRSDVYPSSSIEQLRKSLSKNISNPGLQATSKTSTRNMRESNKISHTKSEKNASEVSFLKVPRATEPKLKPLNSLIPKGLTSLRNKEQGSELQGNKVLKRNPSVDMKKPTPSTPTLKRKTFEESADTPRLTSLKRLSASPCSNNIRSSSEIVVDKQVSTHVRMADEKFPTPRLDVSLQEMDISSSIDNDGNFEKAEACSKELEDICNMLKKKHEEAKDILVRAIVNNNNLLMLNHPIYQDKIRKVQKFAEMLMIK